MMKKVLVLLALLAMTGIASANILTNASFENATLDDYGALVPDNWNIWSDTWDGNWIQVTDGTAFDAASQLDLAANAGVVVASQSAYVSGTGETGSVSFMVRNDGTLDATIEIGADYGPTDFSGWWGDEHISLTIAADGQWHSVSHTWLLWDGVGVSPKIAVFAGTEAGQISVDAASFTVVPEPATMALLGLGALVLRRKK